VCITEATFGLPVFPSRPCRGRGEKAAGVGGAVSRAAHLVGAYSLGKAQRVIALLREAGYDAPVYLHGAMEKITHYYQSRGVALGELRPARGMKKSDLAGTITLAPPTATSTSGRGGFPIRSRRSPRAGCAFAPAPASAASSCRW